MNPTDEEVQNSKGNPTPEEIEALLEPKAIPEERITRHAERNDSYRESPTTGNDEVIVQPPLEPEVLEPIHPVEELQSSESVTAPQAHTEEEVLHNEIPVEVEHRITQDEILASTPADEESVTDNQAHSEVMSAPVSEQKVVLASDFIVPPTEPLVTQTEPEPLKQETPQAPDGAPVAYHTVSGGPETIHDKMAAQHKVDEANAPPVNTVHPLVTSASGYTIPNPNYIQPLQPERESQSNFGMVFFLILLALVGGSTTYLYFFMPELFDKIFDAVTVIFNELIKKYSA